MNRNKNERGNTGAGCLIFLVIIFVIAACGTLFTDGGTSDCYSTPGAQPGSAQHDRDVQRCINP